LRNLLDSGQIGLMLQLLVLAEDSYYQWQRLRLERVRVIETDHLAGVIARANEQLAADLRRDSEMVGLLQARLATYAAQRPLERLHPLASRDLHATMTSLRHDIEAFADARRVQVSSWSVLTQPTLRDAIQELRDRTAATGQHAITQASVVAKEIGGTATDVGQAVAGGASALDKRCAAEPPRSRVASYNAPAITPTIRSSERRGSEEQMTGQPAVDSMARRMCRRVVGSHRL